MIVKIQKSMINGNSMLIYSKDREIMYQDNLTPDISKLLGTKCKGYFKAELNEEGKLMIGEKVKNQNW
jgi:hypothetical protein